VLRLQRAWLREACGLDQTSVTDIDLIVGSVREKGRDLECKVLEVRVGREVTDSCTRLRKIVRRNLQVTDVKGRRSCDHVDCPFDILSVLQHPCHRVFDVRLNLE
jgi:hypothetical protein